MSTMSRRATTTRSTAKTKRRSIAPCPTRGSWDHTTRAAQRRPQQHPHAHAHALRSAAAARCRATESEARQPPARPLPGALPVPGSPRGPRPLLPRWLQQIVPWQASSMSLPPLPTTHSHRWSRPGSMPAVLTVAPWPTPRPTADEPSNQLFLVWAAGPRGRRRKEKVGFFTCRRRSTSTSLLFRPPHSFPRFWGFKYCSFCK